jgi:hypothetical protein
MSDSIKVQSSLILTVNYDAGAQRLRVLFCGGKSAVCHPVSPELYGHFLIAESKGRFYRYHLAKLATMETPTEETAASEPARPLHIIMEDDCCAGPLNRAVSTGRLDKAETWTHVKCGCEWRSRAADGVIYWTPVTIIQVF